MTVPVRRLFRFRLRRVAFCVWCAGAALAAALLWRHHLAGSIKSRKTQHHAVLDWVEIEKQEAVPELAGSLKQGDGDMRRFAGILYADKAVADFVKTMRDKYPDSLFILSSDHASA